MSSKITIEFEGIDVKDIDSINVDFKDGRPTMSKTVSRPDGNGGIVSTTTVTPYDADRAEHKPFGKKVADHEH